MRVSALQARRRYLSAAPTWTIDHGDHFGPSIRPAEHPELDLSERGRFLSLRHCRNSLQSHISYIPSYLPLMVGRSHLAVGQEQPLAVLAPTSDHAPVGLVARSAGALGR